MGTEVELLSLMLRRPDILAFPRRMTLLAGTLHLQGLTNGRVPLWNDLVPRCSAGLQPRHWASGQASGSKVGSSVYGR